MSMYENYLVGGPLLHRHLSKKIETTAIDGHFCYRKSENIRWFPLVSFGEEKTEKENIFQLENGDA